MITGHVLPQGNTSKTQVLHQIQHIRIKFSRVLHENTYQRTQVACYCPGSFSSFDDRSRKFSLDMWTSSRDYISHSLLQ